MTNPWPASLAGFAVEHHASVGSTMDLARARILSGASRCVVVADVQTGGRGRQGRQWMSPTGNLYASIVVERRFAAARAPLFSLIAAVAVADAIGDPRIALKWPNDVLLGGRKLAGLLLEAGERHLVAGLGLNIEASPVADGVSLQEMGLAVPPVVLLKRVLVGLDAGVRDLEEGNVETWRERWLARAAWLNETIRVHLADRVVTGRHRGIDSLGALRLETAAGLETILAGDVERVRVEDLS